MNNWIKAEEESKEKHTVDLALKENAFGSHNLNRFDSNNSKSINGVLVLLFQDVKTLLT